MERMLTRNMPQPPCYTHLAAAALKAGCHEERYVAHMTKPHVTCPLLSPSATEVLSAGSLQAYVHSFPSVLRTKRACGDSARTGAVNCEFSRRSSWGQCHASLHLARIAHEHTAYCKVVVVLLIYIYICMYVCMYVYT